MASMMISISRKLSSKFIRPSFSSCISSLNFFSQDSKFEGIAHYSNSKLTQRTQPLNPNFHFSSNASTIQKPKSFPQTLDLKLKVITLTNIHLKNQNSREFSTSCSSSEPDISALANEARVELKKMMKFQYDVVKLDASVLIVILGLFDLIGYNMITEAIPVGKSILEYGWAFVNVSFILLLSCHALNAWSYPMFNKFLLEKIKKLVEEGREEDLADFLQQIKTSNFKLVMKHRALQSKHYACIVGALVAFVYLLF